MKTDARRFGLRVYLIGVGLNQILGVCVFTYVILYIMSRITPSERAFADLIAQIAGFSMAMLLIRPWFLWLYKKYYNHILAAMLVVSVIQALTIINYPAVSNCIQALALKLLWEPSDVVITDQMNKLSKGAARTKTNLYTSIVMSVGGVIGSLLVMLIDYFSDLSPVVIAIMTFADDATYAFVQFLTRINFEKALR